MFHISVYVSRENAASPSNVSPFYVLRIGQGHPVVDHW